MSEQVFYHSQNGPYQQQAAIKVKDGGNGLPIMLAMATGDPPSTTTNAMTITQAKRYMRKLGEAIEAAEQAGIHDAGF